MHSLAALCSMQAGGPWLVHRACSCQQSWLTPQLPGCAASPAAHNPQTPCSSHVWSPCLVTQSASLGPQHARDTAGLYRNRGTTSQWPQAAILTQSGCRLRQQGPGLGGWQLRPPARPPKPPTGCSSFLPAACVGSGGPAQGNQLLGGRQERVAPVHNAELASRRQAA